MFEQWGKFPAEVGRLTLPQLRALGLLGAKKQPKKRPTLTLAQAKALGLR